MFALPAFLVALSLSASAAPIRKLRPRDAFSSLVQTLTPATGTTPVNVSSQDITTLGLASAAALSGAAYCTDVAAKNWTCPSCAVVPDMQVLFTSGDGGVNPRLYIGFSPALNTLVVGHEGTEQNVAAFVGDLDFPLVDLDSSLDNGNTNGAQVHQGFQDNYLNTSQAVLDQVNSALSGVAKGATSILSTGHSLGAADSLLTGIHLKLNLPNMDLQVANFGMPRPGNPEFADYAASILGDSLVHVTNNNDLVPRVPGTFLGYQQTITELWIDPSGQLELCPGVENDACSAGISDSDLSVDPHDGPYFGTTMGTDACSA